jgi:two-component system, response regulator RegA
LRKSLLAGKLEMRDARSLILVEDDAKYAGVLARSLERRGYRVRIAADPDALEKLLGIGAFHYAIVDLNLNSASGLPCIAALRSANPTTLILVVSGFASPADTAEALRLGACCCLAKPVNSDDIEAAFAGAWQTASSCNALSGAVCDPRPTLAAVSVRSGRE